MIPVFAIALALCTQPAPDAAGPAPSPLPEPLTQQLEALRPTDPEAYLRLAEEVADDGQRPRLAVELAVLAFGLDLARPSGSGPTASSACMVLASRESRDESRRWLVALARSLDARRVPAEWLAPASAPTAESSAYQVATAMGLVRSGEGIRARQLLNKPEVRAALDRHDRALLRVGVQGGAPGLIREADLWPCPLCANARIVKRGADARECPQCEGNPGPKLTYDGLVAQLRFESWLLQGVQRSWAAQVASDLGTPLLDPEPGTVAGTFLVDLRLCYWRRGAWAGTQDGSPLPKEIGTDEPKDEKKGETPAPAPAPASGASGS